MNIATLLSTAQDSDSSNPSPQHLSRVSQHKAMLETRRVFRFALCLDDGVSLFLMGCAVRDGDGTGGGGGSTSFLGRGMEWF